MAYPQPLGYTGANVTGGQTSAQEDWPVEFSELAPAFDLLDILNSNGDFGQQNQNVELALHGLDKSDQFRTAFPPSHNRVTTSTSWPSVQAAPSFHAEQTQILDRQAYHPSHHVQTGQILGSGDASAFPFSVPDVFQGSQYLRVRKYQTRM
jgi:hypothetical protein